MQRSEEHFARKYLREEVLPSTFCSGCGCGTVINCFLKAVEEEGFKDLKNFVFCSGIGCSSWIPSPYMRADSIHTTHGRSIPVALGLKLVRPELNVVVFGGDGDIAAIGLNHLLHAARRNLEVVVIMVNNMIYGMTGGQAAPTTPFGVKTTTTPHGTFEYPLDVSSLMVSAGASYVARWTTYHVVQLKEAMKKALRKKGFSFLEVVSQCPPIYGRRIGMESATQFLNWFRSSSIALNRARNMKAEELINKIVVGELVDIDKPTLLENMRKVQEKAAN